MCKFDADLVLRANERTRKIRFSRLGALCLDEIVVSTKHRGKIYSKTLSSEILRENFGKSYYKVMRNAAQL